MGFINWFDTKGKQWIDEPFQSYYTKYTKSFPDWLLGYASQTVDDSKRYGKRDFNGTDNLLKTLLNIGRDKGQLMKQTNATDLADAMNKKISELEGIERQLYKSLGCRNFEDFCDLWYGRSNQKLRNDLNNFWLQKHLDFCTGQYQRIFYNRGYTPLEQMLGLYAIEFDKLNIESNDKHFKDFIRQELLENGLVEKIKQKSKKGKNQSVYIFKDLTEQESFQEVGKIIEESYEAYAVETGQQLSIDLVKKTVQGALSLDKRRDRIKIRKSGGGIGPINSISSGFVNLTFQAAENKSPSQQISYITDQVIKYLDYVRKMTLSEEEWQQWVAYEQNNNGKEFINKKFRELCKAFLFGKDWTSFIIEEKRMGILGELAAYGRSFFNLSMRKNYENILSTSFLLNQHSQELGADLILQVKVSGKTENYGIQVKNPFKTDKGYYETYKKTWNLGEAKSIQKFYDSIGLDDYGQVLFEMLNINLNNAQRSYNDILGDIYTFLRYYSLEFTKLDEEEIQDLDTMKEIDESFKKISDGKITNLFFVLKGELIQSSAIIKGLLQQYELMINSVKNDKINELSNALSIEYRNKVPKNEREIKPRRNKNGRFSKINRANLKYNPDWIITGGKYRNLLSYINFSTSLQLQIPSLSALGILKKR